MNKNHNLVRFTGILELVLVANIAEKIAITNSVIDGCSTLDSRVADVSQLCPGMPGGNMEYGIGNREYGIGNINVVASVTELCQWQCSSDKTLD